VPDPTLHACESTVNGEYDRVGAGLKNKQLRVYARVVGCGRARARFAFKILSWITFFVQMNPIQIAKECTIANDFPLQTCSK
jgi:hypothetical protein